MNLLDAAVGEEYIIKDIVTHDEELNAFLFTLGCYKGEKVKVVRHLKNACIISIKAARYNIDKDLAQAVII